MGIVRAVSLGLAGVLTLVLGTGCGDKEVQSEPLIRPVRFQPVFATGGSRVRSFSGVAQAGLESSLSFKVAGSIRRVAVQVGDSVRAGDLIADLDHTDFELRVEQAQASLTQAQAQARKAKADLERTRGLYESRNASKSDLEQARSASESAAAVVDATGKALELAGQQLTYCRLGAPTAGAIAEVSVEANENVQAGQKVAKLTSGARMEVAVGVPEMLIAQVREGDPVTVAFDALPGQSLAARVTEVGVSASGVISTFSVAVTLNQANPDVRPGMAAEVSFSFASQSQRERFVVPPVAVGEDRDGRFLFVAQPDSGDVATVLKRAVVVGELTGDGLEILEGLNEGDLLVTAGISKITDGQKVRLPVAAHRAP